MACKRVLVTLDGSRLAEQALKAIQKVAEPGAVVHLLSVITADNKIPMVDFTSPDGPWPTDPANFAEAVRARCGYLEEVSEEICQAGFRCETEVRQGQVIDTILDVAREGYEVVVMATHGRGDLERAALGSVAEGVLRKAPCPVLVISPYAS